MNPASFIMKSLSLDHFCLTLEVLPMRKGPSQPCCNGRLNRSQLQSYFISRDKWIADQISRVAFPLFFVGNGSHALQKPGNINKICIKKKGYALTLIIYVDFFFEKY